MVRKAEVESQTGHQILGSHPLHLEFALQGSSALNVTFHNMFPI